MFLAINEIKRAKLRYGLISGLLFLIAYLMFFFIGTSFWFNARKSISC